MRQISAHHADIREWEHEKAVAAAAEAAKKKTWADKEELRYLMKVGFWFEQNLYKFKCC